MSNDSTSLTDGRILYNNDIIRCDGSVYKIISTYPTFVLAHEINNPQILHRLFIKSDIDIIYRKSTAVELTNEDPVLDASVPVKDDSSIPASDASILPPAWSPAWSSASTMSPARAIIWEPFCVTVPIKDNSSMLDAYVIIKNDNFINSKYNDNTLKPTKLQSPKKQRHSLKCKIKNRTRPRNRKW